MSSYAGTILNETTHAVTGAPDVSELFEVGLTELLGLTAEGALPEKCQRRKVPGTGRKIPGSKKKNHRDLSI